MNVCLDCLPCLARNAVDAARRATADAARQRALAGEMFRMLSEAELNVPPPCLARRILEIAEQGADDSVDRDFYAAEKTRSTALAQALVAELGGIAEYDPDSFESRLRLVVAGNILDFSIYADLDVAAALRTVRLAFTKPVDTAAVRRLEARMAAAKRILYLLDNCGEAVFDRVFIGPYREKTTIAVRGQPVFNDVTRAEVGASGFDGFDVIDNGNGVPGVVLDRCPAAFRAAFEAADLIVAKGQANFETLNETSRPTAFLFLAKCPVVTRLINAEPQSIQVRLANC